MQQCESILRNEVNKEQSFRIEIEYCTQCNWMIRATWVTQEILNSFENNIEEICLIPSGGGIFEIRINGDIVWSLKLNKKFPEPKEIKQIVRDKVDPQRSLGHGDRH